MKIEITYSLFLYIYIRLTFQFYYVCLGNLFPMTTFLTVIFIKQATDESRFSDRSTLNQSKHDRSVQKLQREDNTNFRLSENYRELRAFKSDDSNVIDLQRNFPFSSTSLLAFFILSILNLFRLNLFFHFHSISL